MKHWEVEVVFTPYQGYNFFGESYIVKGFYFNHLISIMFGAI